jgi:hypothetical protein
MVKLTGTPSRLVQRKHLPLMDIANGRSAARGSLSSDLNLVGPDRKLDDLHG